MIIRLSLLALTVSLLTSCNSFDTIIENESSKCYPGVYGPELYKKAYFTNTSKSRFLEVTIKAEGGGTAIKQLRPGERKYVEIGCSTKVSIVGEREITDND